MVHSSGEDSGVNHNSSILNGDMMMGELILTPQVPLIKSSALSHSLGYTTPPIIPTFSSSRVYNTSHAKLRSTHPMVASTNHGWGCSATFYNATVLTPRDVSRFEYHGRAYETIRIQNYVDLGPQHKAHDSLTLETGRPVDFQLSLSAPRQGFHRSDAAGPSHSRQVIPDQCWGFRASTMSTNGIKPAIKQTNKQKLTWSRFRFPAKVFRPYTKCLGLHETFYEIKPRSLSIGKIESLPLQL